MKDFLTEDEYIRYVRSSFPHVVSGNPGLFHKELDSRLGLPPSVLIGGHSGMTTNNTMNTMNDEVFMKKALELAKKGAGYVNPNPMVGCVVVAKGKIAGTGYHKYFGGPHAEINALTAAKAKSRGATMYVNLEPCCHYGKTPPCTDTIIKAGIKNVIISIRDPNPLVNNHGLHILKKAGIKVKTGVLASESTELNRAFVKFIRTGLPYVTLKTALSLDGKIATANGDSKWITGKEARLWTHKLRSEVDAILVGHNTALSDNPALTSHGLGRDPVRIVLDTNLGLPSTLKIFSGNGVKTWVATGRKVNVKKAEFLRQKGVILIKCPLSGTKIDLKYLMRELAKNNISHVLIEGGGEVNFGAIKEGIVDEIAFFVAPIIIGGREAKTPVEGEGIKHLSDALRLNSVSVERIGQDILIRGKIKNKERQGSVIPAKAGI